MKKILSLCMCFIILITALTGCGSNIEKSEESVSNVSNTEKSQESDSSENNIETLTMAVGAELTTLYPVNMDEQNLSATRLCYEGLVNYKDGEIVPWLAKTWEISDDGCTLTFKLRDDVTFHDGKKFNAEAVKVNFESKSKNPNFRAYPAVVNLKEVEVLDGYTVAFHYDEPFFGYLTDFSYREIMVCVSPDVIEEDNFQTMKGVVGTGPYIYDEVKDGEYVKFIRNDNYWGQKPYYDEIYVKYIPEAASRLLALQKGDIDMIYGSGLITWDDFNQATANENIKGIVSPVDSKTTYLILNAANPALEEKAVREAIAYGIDKQAICDGLTYGNQKIAEDIFPDGNFLSDMDLNIIRKYDKTKANKILEDANWKINEKTGFREKDGVALSFKLTYNSGDAMNKMLSATIKSQLKELGINAEAEGQDMMTWWKEGVAGNYGMIIWGTEENTAPHINFPKMLNSSPHTPSLNALDGSEKVFDSIKKLETTKDIEEAKELYSMILNYSNDNILEVPLYYPKDMILFNKNKIANYTFTDTPVMFEIDNVVPAQ